MMNEKTAEREINRVLLEIGYTENDDWDYRLWDKMMKKLSSFTKNTIIDVIKKQISDEKLDGNVESMLKIILNDAPDNHPSRLFDLETDYLGDVEERANS